MYYDHKRKNGKNSKIYYYAQNCLRLITPKCKFRRRLKGLIESAPQREDYDYVAGRVNYYNKLKEVTLLPESAPRILPVRMRGNNSVYVFDSFEYLRWFSSKLKWEHLFGDIIHVPDLPSIVKSRPLTEDNANSVVLNLDKVRHFTFLDDRKPFREKKDMFIYRGHIIAKPNRIRLMEEYFNNPMCDAGIISPSPIFPEEWVKDAISLWEHLDYKFILALEGNDAASNLKWIMSSNSVAVMPQPTCETWFMEGTLIPEYHYIEIKPDFSDLIEKVEYYIEHPEKAEAIARNANEYIKQFLKPEREDLISLMVLDKYFEKTGQGTVLDDKSFEKAKFDFF